MRKVILPAILAFLFASCQQNSQNQNTKIDSANLETPSIGGLKDKHGCLTSAGQTWSQIKNDCIQVFSVGVRLNPIQVDSTQAIISAFVVPNDDSTGYELFLPEEEETFILEQQSPTTFSKNQYIYNKDTGELLINKVLSYKSE
ncbi:hypothetical protein [Sphingobacterium composti Ten et al. 2007 non Yoo et al. 2007]|uniref:hypothetical protein n=1 Tax=Sphingobacterium composti TaxID=363260 RepID=UPI00135948C8|nr:hypothetical protein [Sphingobacterium composti Ten et al. 2007 non Yoo et al. 2007]